MNHDWLLGIPTHSFKEMCTWAEERMAEDPSVATFDDDEAEAFFCVAYMLRSADTRFVNDTCRAVGLHVQQSGEMGKRRAILQILRRWAKPKIRDYLTYLVPNTYMPPWLDPVEHPEFWTEERYVEALCGGVNIVWLVRIRRFLTKGENLSQWLAQLDDWAEREYRQYLNVSKITLRRLVYPPAAAPREQVAVAAQSVLMAEVRAKERHVGALRSSVRRLEQDRKALKQQARRVELEARAQLSQARGEVEAARRSLKALKEAHAQELASRAQRHDIQVRALRHELALLRSQFVRSLRELTARTRCNVLQGRTITVEGNAWDHDIQRLLVESLGGRLLPSGGEVTFPAPASFAQLEEALRGLAFQRVQVKCDGLYRKRDGRPGIAVSGVQVQLGDSVVYRNSHVAYCGPLAGSLMAEYGAVAMALSWLVAAAPPAGARVEILTDCRALLSRLRRRAPKKKPGCIQLDATVRRLIRKLERSGCHVTFRWVPRDEVHAVDRLCYHAYRNLGWYHRRGARPRASLQTFLHSALHV